MIQRNADGLARPADVTRNDRAQSKAGDKPTHARQSSWGDSEMIRRNGRKMISTTERALNIAGDRKDR